MFEIYHVTLCCKLASKAVCPHASSKHELAALADKEAAAVFTKLHSTSASEHGCIEDILFLD